MKKLLTLAALALLTNVTSAQENENKTKKEEGFKFEEVLALPITPIKNQANSGTCWAYSALSFMESEIIRAGHKGDIDLAEMFIVHNAYRDRAEKFVRLHGHLNFGAGSSFGNVIAVMKKDGIVPQSVFPGLNYGTDHNNHQELDALTSAYVNVIKDAPQKYLTPAWKKGYLGILNAYLGEIPSTFQVDGKEFTPKTYLESLKINMDDYIDLTSWTHHPFYEQMVIEVPDNWIWERAYNLPLDELIEAIDASLENGYTVAWASDVSEDGFTRNGLAVLPNIEKMEMVGTDQAKWLKMSAREKSAAALNSPCPELEVTQEMRQEAYDNFQTTDDHGMHIYGIAKDQTGKKYYMVKNSWGENAGAYKGFWYVSEAYVRYKTMDIVINKNALPKSIRKKLSL